MKRVIILRRAGELLAWLSAFLEEADQAGHLDSFLDISLQMERKPQISDSSDICLDPHLGPVPTRYLKPLCRSVDQDIIDNRDLFVQLSLIESPEQSRVSVNIKVDVESPVWESQYTEVHTAFDLLRNRNLHSGSMNTCMSGRLFDLLTPKDRFERLLEDYNQSQQALRFLKGRLSESLKVLISNYKSPMYALIKVYKHLCHQDDTAEVLWQEFESIELVNYDSMMDYILMKIKWAKFLTIFLADITEEWLCEELIAGLTQEYTYALEEELLNSSYQELPGLSALYHRLLEVEQIVKARKRPLGATRQREGVAALKSNISGRKRKDANNRDAGTRGHTTGPSSQKTTGNPPLATRSEATQTYGELMTQEFEDGEDVVDRTLDNRWTRRRKVTPVWF